MRLNGGALQSIERALVLNGANALAVETQDGSFEILQFERSELQPDGSFVLSNLLRGQSGTDVEMRLGSPQGARVVLLDERLLEVPLNPAERGVELNWRVGPAGDPVASSSHAELVHVNTGRGRRMLAPVHLRYRKLASSELRFNWIRRSRIDGDSWEDTEIPLDVREERYNVLILDGTGAVRRETVTTVATFDYAEADRLADLGTLTASFDIRVAQISDTEDPGAFAELENITP